MEGCGWLKAAICLLAPRTVVRFGELVDTGMVLSLWGFSGWSSASLEPKPGAGLEKHWRNWCQGPLPLAWPGHVLTH